VGTKEKEKDKKKLDRDEINELKRAFAYNLFYNRSKTIETANMTDFIWR